MKCVICKTGEVAPGRATCTVDRGGRTIVLRDVPAEVCGQCGEPYFEEAVARHISEQVDRARASGADVAVLTYDAA